MTQRRALGEILVRTGRITEADVATALEYQRVNGGFFGSALVACGLVSESEIEWGLASQYDLPYVFPNAEEIDYDAAAMVSPEWALANLALPIMRTATTITLVVESPLVTRPVDELRARTDLEVAIALSSPPKIRELIRQVYARASASDKDAARPPVGLSEALDIILACGAPRFGVSVRAARSWVWWDESGSVRRRPLSGDWQGEMERSFRPSIAALTAQGGHRQWAAELARSGYVASVEVRFLADESGQEYLFRPRPAQRPARASYEPPPSGLVSEVMLLARTGKARFIFSAAPPQLGHELLPRLPELFLDPMWRSIYVHSRDHPAALEVFSLKLAEDRATWREQIESLRAFQFDAVAVDLPGGDGDWIASALDLGALSFLLWADQADVGPAFGAGIRWHLRASSRGDGQLEWSLEPLQV